MFASCVRQYCCLRERTYCSHDDADLTVRDNFAYVIQVQVGAATLLGQAHRHGILPAEELD